MFINFSGLRFCDINWLWYFHNILTHILVKFTRFGTVITCTGLSISCLIWPAAFMPLTCALCCLDFSLRQTWGRRTAWIRIFFPFFFFVPFCFWGFILLSSMRSLKDSLLLCGLKWNDGSASEWFTAGQWGEETQRCNPVFWGRTLDGDAPGSGPVAVHVCHHAAPLWWPLWYIHCWHVEEVLCVWSLMVWQRAVLTSLTKHLFLTRC